jgi:tetratricopeptide (TPR) repeat protein
MKTWLVYILVSQLTQSPLLGVVAVAALWFGGGSWWFGRLPNPLAPFKTWSRMRELRAGLAMNPHDMNLRSELGGLLATRDPAEAKALLEEVVRRCPDIALSIYYLGLAQLGLGETEAGRASIERALAMRKDLRFGEPLVRLGDHYLRKGDTAAALAAFERATVVHGSYAEAWYKAGTAARAAGDAAKAKAHFRSTLSTTEHAPAFKRRQDRVWRWRAWWALRSG